MACWVCEKLIYKMYNFHGYFVCLDCAEEMTIAMHKDKEKPIQQIVGELKNVHNGRRYQKNK